MCIECLHFFSNRLIFFIAEMDGGLALLRSHSKALERGNSAINILTVGDANVENKYSFWPLLDFVTIHQSHHYLESLKISMELVLRKAAFCVLAMEVLHYYDYRSNWALFYAFSYLTLMCIWQVLDLNFICLEVATWLLENVTQPVCLHDLLFFCFIHSMAFCKPSLTLMQLLPMDPPLLTIAFRWWDIRLFKKTGTLPLSIMLQPF